MHNLGNAQSAAEAHGTLPQTGCTPRCTHSLVLSGAAEMEREEQAPPREPQYRPQACRAALAVPAATALRSGVS